VPSRRNGFRRLAVIIAVGLFLVGSVQFVWHFWVARPIGEGPAGPHVPAEAFEAPWGEREVVLLGLGDSVTAGYGARPDKAFMARLVSNPEDEFESMRGICLSAVLPRLHVQNVAVSGSDSLQHVEKQIPALQPFPKEVFGIVVMTTGGNDLIHWYGTRPPMEGAMYGATLEQAQPWIAHFEQRLTGMLDSIVELFPGGCKIFLGNIYDPSDGGADPRLAGLPRWDDAMAVLDAYNAVIARCAAQNENVALVDIHGAFLGHGVRCAQFWRSFYRAEDPHYWYFDNIEDPNERGHDALRRIFLLKMIEELCEKPSLFHPQGA
jgi:lysophospholipase L1-like esterase